MSNAVAGNQRLWWTFLVLDRLAFGRLLCGPGIAWEVGRVFISRRVIA